MLLFTKDFTQQEPLPDASVANALLSLKSGRLHRYNVHKGDKGFAAELEEAFAAYMGRTYCLACASCGSALYLALKSCGMKPGDMILCNSYTLAPVPGAIENAGGTIVLVETADDYTIDLADLEAKATATGAKFFMLSHMRGHIGNMDAIMDICHRHNLVLIEDCAHTMGAKWDGKKSGNFGRVGCFSTQTYKHINSGEGGLLVTDDDEIMARAILYSGSYMLYGMHTLRPPETVFEKVKKITPNYSCRMDNLRAGILLPQIATLERQCERWNSLYRHMESLLNSIPGVCCPKRDPREDYVGSSIQFDLKAATSEEIETFLAQTARQGVSIKWFGNKEPVGFTSAYDSWQYFSDLPDLPRTKKVLATMCDMRLPLTFTLDDCTQIAAIIAEVLQGMSKA